MMPRPKRRARPRMGCREERKLRFPTHCQYVRGFECAVPRCNTGAPIDATHFDGPIPNEDRAGMSERDHDKWTWPCCRIHHTEYHGLGWRKFDAKHGIDSKAKAEEMARLSPHKTKWMEPTYA